ncbi:MAG TPA: DUF721 domain-containing protein [candidate division Zixibacteria bacterium]|nr:DUF721 domain-containing protein [candidate division Zixibacteria bacterium]
MADKDSQLEHVGAVLEKSLRRLDLSARLEEYGVWPIWNDTVGLTIARNAQPEKIRNGTLFVKVSSPVWMQQLQYMKEMIAEKLNQRLGAELVKNIFFVVGKIDGPAQERTPKNPPAPPEPLQGEEFLDKIEDPEIRQSFKKILAGHARRRRKEPPGGS